MNYIEVPTDRQRVEKRNGREVVQVFCDKIAEPEIMIIDGKRCRVQRVVGGVWRDLRWCRNRLRKQKG